MTQAAETTPGTAIDTRQAESLPAPQSESAAILSMIERMAVDPNIDPDRIERFIALKERMDANAAKVAYNAAYATMQPELPAIPKRGQSNTGNYALWEDIQDRIIPVLAEHGFGLSFKTKVEGETITVTAILRHEAGHEDSTELPLPTDKSGSKNNVQGVGSSVSYGKRYTASALLNIRVAGEDDDGVAAGIGDLVSMEQIEALQDLINEAGTTTEKFCKWAKVQALKEIPASRFKECESALLRKREASS